ncbi:MAG: T9SS type A sorting domain-containing protein, partial [Flavobacteriaceae bacterium]|nr:T9SS type A sorting domain-containing protein [Flavobacteriaceae bacterium]
IDQVDEINIFPVPFDAEINIRYKFNYDTKIKIELFDMKGVQLLKVENINYIKGTTGQSKLNLSEMSNQLLLLNLSTSQGQFTKKIISN